MKNKILNEEDMLDLMRERSKTRLQAWREILEYIEEDEIVVKQKKCVERAVKRAEKKLIEKCIILPEGPNKENILLDTVPGLSTSIDNASMELVYDCLDKKDWDAFEKIVLLNGYAMQMVFDYMFNVIPDDRKYRLTVEAYSWGGAVKKGVQNAVKKLPELGKPELPEEFEETVTIYRGCNGDADKAAESFSWTTNLEVAKFFGRMHENTCGQEAHIYCGKIRKDDIAAYILELGQSEVIQLGKVYDVVEIDSGVSAGVRSQPSDLHSDDSSG